MLRADLAEPGTKVEVEIFGERFKAIGAGGRAAVGSEEREIASLTCPDPSSRISGIVPSGKDGWEVHFAAMTRKEAGEDIIMLSVGDHDFDTPAETVEACVAAVRGGHHHYTQLPGIPRLREAMAKSLDALHRRRHQRRTRSSPRRAARPRSTPPSRPCSTPATTPSSSRPTTPPIPARSAPPAPVSPWSRRRPRTVSSRAPTTIDAALQPNTRAILINTPNNPTGAVYTRERLEGIAEICREHDLWLLSDEVYWTLGGGEHVSPRALPGMAERTLVINSMSKSHGMTGWRIGWLTGPEADRSRC